MFFASGAPSGSWRRKLLFWKRGTSSHPSTTHEAHQDHALVLAVTATQKMPRWQQLRHLHRILNATEFRLFLVFIVGTIIALLFGIGSLLAPHFISVPAHGGTVTEGLVGTPKLINPVYSALNDVDRDLASLVYSGLFQLDRDLRPVPDLAESYVWSDQGKTLEVTIRPDARFHDKMSVTADDVVFTVQAIRNPAWRSPIAKLFRPVKAVRISDRVVQFRLDRPNPSILAILTIGILPAHVWEDVSETNANLADANIKPIGSGPYQVESFTRDSNGAILLYQLRRFPLYYGPAPSIDRWRFRFFADRKAAENALQNNQIDTLAFVPWATIDSIKTPAAHPITVHLPQETIAFFNLRDPVLQNEQIRKALNLAVDREELLHVVDSNTVPLTTVFPFLEQTAPATSTGDRLQEARNMLETLGWTLTENQPVRTWSPPIVRQRLTTRTTTVPAFAFTTTTPLALTISVPDQPDLLKIAEFLQRRWSMIGVKVTLEQDNAETLLKTSVQDRSYQVLVWNILVPPTHDISAYWQNDKNGRTLFNFSQFDDTVVNAAFERTEQATTTEALREAHLAISQAIMARTPALFLLRPTYAYLVSNHIKNTKDIKISVPSDRLLRARDWWIKTTWTWK